MPPRGGATAGLLAGIRVADFTQALAGPYCTMILADLGADVVKVEPPNGDQTRAWGPPFISGESAYFLSINRGKRSVVLDFGEPDDRDLAHRLALNSDVVVENFRPGTLDRIGLGPDHLREQKPELIYASISGFGQGYPDLPGYDHIVQGTSGLMSLNGYATAPPVKVGIPIGDLSAGMFAVHAILAALHARGGTGVGAYIDVGMQDSLLALLTFQAGRYLATGAVPGRSGNRHPTISPYGTYRTSDGYLNLAAGTDRLWRKLCAALGLQTLIGDARFLTNSDRVTNGSALDEEIEVVLQEKGTTHWLNVLGEASVPCGPIRTVSEAFADRMVDERGSLMRMDHRAAGDIETVSPPWRIDGANMAADRPPPTLGQHTVEILKEVRSLAELEQRIIGGLG